MATIGGTDGPLAVARRRLDDAVARLADPRPQWIGSVLRYEAALYERLRGALNGAVVARRQVHMSRLPCRADVLTLLVSVDTTVASWEHGKSTIDRLHQLVGRGRRPQDCELMDDYSARLERWALTAVELLELAPRVYLSQPCPRCGARFAYRRDGAGESVRVPALRVSEHGCTCQGCDAFWPPDRFEWLARLLGCEPLPA